MLGDDAPADSRARRRTPAVEVFEKWKDSVVYVTGPLFGRDGSKLDEFFDLPGDKKGENSVGTGFIIHPSGYVLANAHAAAKVIYNEVVLADGSSHRAEVVGIAPDGDLALLKIDAGRPLPAVRLGRSGDVMIGETLIVIGHPLGLRYTCTVGVASAVGRTTNVADLDNLTLRDLIQTDAVINPGSSGGPWLNVAGEVMGLGASKERNAEGVSFAISAASIRKRLPEMLDVERRYGLVTGVTLPEDGPCRVESVAPESPAAAAGIQPNDEIAKLAGTPTPTVLDWHLALVGRKPGEPLPIELARGGEPVTVSLTPAARPQPDGAALLRSKLALVAEPLDEATAKAMHLQVPRGVILREVGPKLYDSVEHKPQPGDVLAQINGIRPRDMDHVGLLVEPVDPGDTVKLVFLRHRDGKATRVDMRLVLPKGEGE